MLYETPFNEKMDIRLVEVKDASEYEISSMLANGVVSGANTVDQTSYNMISDHKRIIGRVTNEFEAIKAQDLLLSNGKKSVKNE